MSERFFIVGAQRCGTSYLYQMLDAHPEIQMARPSRPEPKFFIDDSLYSKGLEFYAGTFFPKNGRHYAAKGEKSTSYIEFESAATRIRKSFPQAKIIIMVRNPIDRAASNYRFSVEHGAESLPMDEAFRAEEQRRGTYDRLQYSVSPFAYLQRGRYIDYLNMWRRHFPAGQTRVWVFERLAGSLEVIQSVYEFVGADRRFVPGAIQERVNASETVAEPIPPALRAHLADYFRDSNARLAEALDDSLEEWNWK